MAGRRPKPTQLKSVLGNPGKRALNKREPKPKGIADCPHHLSDKAKEEWSRVAPELIALGLLTRVDRTALAIYCEAYGRWIEADEKAKRVGEIIKTTSGNIIQNPFRSIANRAEQVLLKAAAEFGMTPSSRTRLSSGESDKGDPADEFFDDAVTTGPGNLLRQ